jgi:hypothetical protein
MQNITKKFIIILGAIVFSFVLTNSAQAATYVTNYAYSSDPVGYQYDGNQGSSQYSYYQQSGYNTNPMIPTYPPIQSGYYQQSVYSTSTNNVVADNTTAKPNVVNNYYYQTAPATTAKTNTTSTSKTTSDTSVNDTSVNSDSNNGLGASAYGNGITALSLQGSGGFMPSSIWQWMLVIVLILIIIIISRILMKKPSIEEQEAHIAHAH